MNDLFLYLAKVSAGLAIVFLPYYFLFRNDPNLVIKRFYLLAGVAAAWIFPFITFRKLPLVVDLTPTIFIDLDTPTIQPVLLNSAGTETGLTINWLQVVIFVYLAGLTFMFLKNLFMIIKWNFTWHRTHDKEGVAYTKNDQVFTLFTRIFVPGSLREKEDLDSVLLHEKAHIRQLHFIDLMIMELTLLLTWFNPFSWLISRMIKENHEYLADRQVLSAGVNPARYRAQLMNHTLGVNVFRLGNQFNHSLTLKRFKMMKKPNRSLLGIIKIVLLIPAVLLTLGLTTGMTPQQKTIKGKVVFADTGEPAAGASVVIRSTTTGTVADKDGTFMLNVDGDPELVISFVGYGTLFVKASKIGKKPLKLEIEAVTLDLGSVPEVTKGSAGAIALRHKDGSEAQPVYVVDGVVIDGVENIDRESIAHISVFKDPDSDIAKEYNAKDGVIMITTKEAAAAVKKKEKEIFYVVEEMPTFNGGDPGPEFRKYIAKNLQYPETAAKNGVDGRVIVQFMVNETGQVVDAKVVRSVDPALDKEALRVVNSSPKWTPGKQSGKPVNVLFTFPFNFVIQDPVKEKSKKSEVITLKNKGGSNANPIIVLDGKEVIDGIENLIPDLIESISVIKDPNDPLVKKYNATDGLILVTTKDGKGARIHESSKKEDDKEQSGPFTFKRMEGSDAEPVYVVDGKQVDGIENINSNLIDNLSVIKDPDSPLVKKYNATGGLILVTTKEAAESAKKADEEILKTDKEVFYVVEDMPQFPGGIPAMKSYIYSNLEYPAEAKKKGIEGEVIVQFMINTEGKPENVKVVRSTYEGFDEPAMKVIREMPEWTPGMQRGKAVRVLFAVPIQFIPPKE